MGPTRFSIQIFFHKWLREQWNWKQHLCSCTFSLHTDIQTCDEYFGRKEQLASQILKNILHKWLRNSLVLHEAKLSHSNFMRQGQSYPIAHLFMRFYEIKQF